MTRQPAGYERATSQAAGSHLRRRKQVGPPWPLCRRGNPDYGNESAIVSQSPESLRGTSARRLVSTFRCQILVAPDRRSDTRRPPVMKRSTPVPPSRRDYSTSWSDARRGEPVPALAQPCKLTSIRPKTSLSTSSRLYLNGLGDIAQGGALLPEGGKDLRQGICDISRCAGCGSLVRNPRSLISMQRRV